MKRSDMKIGETYAVVTGSMYEGAAANADPAIVLETGVAVDNFNSPGRASWTTRRPSSTTSDGVRVQILDRKTLVPTGRELVIKSRNVVALWSDHTESMRLQAERAAEADRRRADSAEAVESWAERLGINTYQMPSLSGGISGGVGFDSEYTRNRAALARVLKMAYELGRKEA